MASWSLELNPVGFVKLEVVTGGAKRIPTTGPLSMVTCASSKTSPSVSALLRHNLVTQLATLENLNSHDSRIKPLDVSDYI